LFNDGNLINKTGRSRTVDENKSIINSIGLLLETYLDLLPIEDISINDIIEKVAKCHHCRRQNVAKLYKQFCEDGDVLVFGRGPNSERGPKEEVHRVLQRCHLESITKLVDDYHKDGKTITNRDDKS
jgi:hypothetical protein